MFPGCPMRRCGLVFVIALAATGSLPAHTPAAIQGQLVVTIRDAQGAVIPGAYVLVHPDAVLRFDQALQDFNGKSDESGRFALKVDAGFYDVCVMSDSFKPDCDKERIQPNRTSERKVTLKLDPRVLRITADIL